MSDAELPDLLVLHDELAERWDSYLSNSLTMRSRVERKRVFEVRRATIVYGLAAHVHQTGSLLRQHFEGGVISPALIPLVRNAYECALTAQWVRQAEDGDEAFTNQAVRSGRALKRSLEKSPDAWSRSLADSVAAAGLQVIPTDSDAQARSFEKRCDDLDNGARAYWAYRIMCSLNHPTTDIVDAYIEPDPENVTRPKALRKEPTPLPADSWHAFTLMSMIWSARALTDFAPDNAYRNFLRARARTLGTSADISLAERYHARIFKARAAQRRRVDED